MKEHVVVIDNFGPFEHAEIKLKPLTIFIGRNSVGKSMLMRLLWVLASTPLLPTLSISDEQVKVFERAENNIVSSVVRGVKPSEEDMRATIKWYMELLGEGVRRHLERRIRGAFNAELRELIRIGAEDAKITMLAPCEPTVIVLGREDVRIERSGFCIDGVMGDLAVEVPEPGILRLRYKDLDVSRPIKTSKDFEELIREVLVKHLTLLFKGGFYIGTMWLHTIFLPDNRAGLLQFALQPYSYLSTLFKPSSTVEEEFMDAVLQISTAFGENKWRVLESIRGLLYELECTLIPKFEWGRFNIYVKTWSGKELPLHSASSGVRGSVPIVLALAHPEPLLVFIEEPEAHLHPRAIIRFAELMARAVDTGKRVIVSTQSDRLLIALNNLISSSRDRGVDELDYAGKTISPHNFAAYLITTKDGRAFVHELKVTDTGISGDEFSMIVKELLEE
jgi:predicted ATPase